MNLISTLAGSMMEGFFPAGWDLAKIDACVEDDPGAISKRQKWWHKNYQPMSCASQSDFDMMMGHEIALLIKQTRDEGRQLVRLPSGP